MRQAVDIPVMTPAVLPFVRLTLGCNIVEVFYQSLIALSSTKPGDDKPLYKHCLLQTPLFSELY